MSRTQFPVEVLTPEGKVFEGEVEMLEPCELKLYESGSDNPGSASYESYAQGEGYLQVVDNSALIIVEDAIKPEDLDKSDLESPQSDADSALEDAEEDLTAFKRLGGRPPMLTARGINFSYGQLQVLFDVDFTVDDGEMVALLGTNGAGPIFSMHRAAAASRSEAARRWRTSIASANNSKRRVR